MLASGDVIEIGNTGFRFELPNGVPRAPAGYAPAPRADNRHDHDNDDDSELSTGAGRLGALPGLGVATGRPKTLPPPAPQLPLAGAAPDARADQSPDGLCARAARCAGHPAGSAGSMLTGFGQTQPPLPVASGLAPCSHPQAMSPLARRSPLSTSAVMDVPGAAAVTVPASARMTLPGAGAGPGPGTAARPRVAAALRTARGNLAHAPARRRRGRARQGRPLRPRPHAGDLGGRASDSRTRTAPAMLAPPPRRCSRAAPRSPARAPSSRSPWPRWFVVVMAIVITAIVKTSPSEPATGRAAHRPDAPRCRASREPRRAVRPGRADRPDDPDRPRPPRPPRPPTTSSRWPPRP